MLNMNEKVGDHVIDHVSNPIISLGWYQKDMQTTVFKELMNILNRRQSCEENISKKVNNFF